jgi:RNA polymerase sigma-70 factor (ECF subfamily)
MYLRVPGASESRANGVMVFTLAGDRISELTRFDTSVLGFFGLPGTLRQAKEG